MTLDPATNVISKSTTIHADNKAPRCWRAKPRYHLAQIYRSSHRMFRTIHSCWWNQIIHLKHIFRISFKPITTRWMSTVDMMASWISPVYRRMSRKYKSYLIIRHTHQVLCLVLRQIAWIRFLFTLTPTILMVTIMKS